LKQLLLGCQGNGKLFRILNYFDPFFHVAIELRRGITEFQHIDESFAHQVHHLLYPW
jgi:hypothetical protein